MTPNAPTPRAGPVNRPIPPGWRWSPDDEGLPGTSDLPSSRCWPSPDVGTGGSRSMHAPSGHRSRAVVAAGAEACPRCGVLPAARRDSTDCSVIAGTYEAVLVGVDHGLYAVAAAEFGEHAGDVRLDSALTDVKANGEFLVRQACGNQAKHFPFSFGE